VNGLTTAGTTATKPYLICNRRDPSTLLDNVESESKKVWSRTGSLPKDLDGGGCRAVSATLLDHGVSLFVGRALTEGHVTLALLRHLITRYDRHVLEDRSTPAITDAVVMRAFRLLERLEPARRAPSDHVHGGPHPVRTSASRSATAR
jgi:hypothetical protein